VGVGALNSALEDATFRRAGCRKRWVRSWDTIRRRAGVYCQQTVPDAVTLQDLVNRGFLAQTEVQGFTGMQVTFSLRTNGDPPEEALMRVRFPNGDECIAMGDGSVRQVRR
jgi:hypothetical protein